MPARLRLLAQVAQAKYGISVVAPKKGSHWKAMRDGKSYSLPAHNGPKTELSDVYIRGLCRAFGIDYDEMKGLL
jgi:hypothetical protein